MSDLTERLKKRVEGGLAPIEGPLVIYSDPVSLTVKEASELVKTRPQHANCRVLAQAIQGYGPEMEIFMERADLQAILEGGESFLEVKEENVDGELIRTGAKRFVKKAVVSHAPAPPPKP